MEGTQKYHGRTYTLRSCYLGSFKILRKQLTHMHSSAYLLISESSPVLTLELLESLLTIGSWIGEAWESDPVLLDKLLNVDCCQGTSRPFSKLNLPPLLLVTESGDPPELLMLVLFDVSLNAFIGFPGADLPLTSLEVVRGCAVLEGDSSLLIRIIAGRWDRWMVL